MSDLEQQSVPAQIYDRVSRGRGRGRGGEGRGGEGRVRGGGEGRELGRE